MKKNNSQKSLLKEYGTPSMPAGERLIGRQNVNTRGWYARQQAADAYVARLAGAAREERHESSDKDNVTDIQETNPFGNKFNKDNQWNQWIANTLSRINNPGNESQNDLEEELNNQIEQLPYYRVIYNIVIKKKLKDTVERINREIKVQEREERQSGRQYERSYAQSWYGSLGPGQRVRGLPGEGNRSLTLDGYGTPGTPTGPELETYQEVLALYKKLEPQVDIENFKKQLISKLDINKSPKTTATETAPTSQSATTTSNTNNNNTNNNSDGYEDQLRAAGMIPESIDPRRWQRLAGIIKG